MKRHKSDNLDRMLSLRLKKAVGEEKRADWLDVLGRAGMSRTPWRWSQRRVLLVAGVLVVAVGAAGASTGLIPWLNKTPKQTPPPKYAICGAKDVNAKILFHRHEQSPEVPAGLSGTIVLANKGAGDCALEGQPKVSLVGSGAVNTKLRVELFPEGEDVLPAGVKTSDSVFSPDPKRNSIGDFPGTGQTLLGRAFEPVEQASRIHIWWQNWCGEGSGSDAYDGNLALRLEITNGSIIDLPVRQIPVCNNSAKPSVLRLLQAQAAAIPLGAALPLRAQIVTDGTGKPLVLKVGTVFQYQVALTNMSDHTFRFGKCPTYFQSAGIGTDANNTFPLAGGQYVLNCRSVKAIDPGETVMFEMKLGPLKSETYGQKVWNGAEGVLDWSLDALDTKNPPRASVAFVIETKPSNYSPSDVYSAFAPGTKEATFPPKVESLLKWMHSPAGQFVPGSRRILLKGSSWRERFTKTKWIWPDPTMYAWETESGDVCYKVGDSSFCDKGAAQTDPISVSYYSIGFTTGDQVVPFVAGLARDGVEKVDVVTNDERLHAKLENNAYFVKVPSGRSIVAVVATMADGSQKKVVIPPR
jgi:hypothetical protein